MILPEMFETHMATALVSWFDPLLFFAAISQPFPSIALLYTTSKELAANPPPVTVVPAGQTAVTEPTEPPAMLIVVAAGLSAGARAGGSSGAVTLTVT